MAFPPSFLEELRGRISVVDVVGRRVKLTKRGRNYVGLCPFHNEKSPSFNCSDDRGGYKCFGCGAGGDVFGFVMQTENLTFPEAVEKLAGEAGMEVPRLTPEARERAEQASGLANVLDLAAKWFESQLTGKAGAGARAYAEKRGLSADTIARFRLGFAPQARTAMKEALLARGIPEAQLVEAGLLVKPEEGGATFDRFRNRLMFPIGDRRGRIIAFGGRALDDAPAKYLNSPETPLFHKSRTLYNLAMAREAAPTAGTVIVSEGYMDVIALAQAGFGHAVAPLGTALTEEQMGMLWKLAAEPVLCFDGDKAGWNAALRAAGNCLPLLEPGRSFRFAVLPEGQDPDDLIRAKGPVAMAEVLAAAQPLSDILWRKALEGRALDTPERRAALKKALDEMAGEIANADVREFYRQDFKERLARQFASAATPAAQRQARSAPWTGRGKPKVIPFGGLPASYPISLGQGRKEQSLLAGVLLHPEYLDSHVEELARIDFSSADLDTLRQAVIHAHASAESLDAAGLRHQLVASGHGDLADRLMAFAKGKISSYLRPGAAPEQAEAEWRETLATFRLKALADEKKAIGQRLEEAGSDTAMRQLRSLRLEETDLMASHQDPQGRK